MLELEKIRKYKGKYNFKKKVSYEKNIKIFKIRALKLLNMR
jgi:hypothetical protein